MRELLNAATVGGMAEWGYWELGLDFAYILHMLDGLGPILG